MSEPFEGEIPYPFIPPGYELKSRFGVDPLGVCTVVILVLVPKIAPTWPNIPESYEEFQSQMRGAFK